MERKIYLADYYRERFTWLKEHHICVKCGCEEAEPNRTLCLECGEQEKERQRKRYKEQKEEIKIRSNNNSKRRYYERKEKGICVRCGKYAENRQYIA